MKIRILLFGLAIPFVLGGCVVADDDTGPIVTVPSTPPVTVEKDQPDVNIEVKQDPIVIKEDPPTKATTGF